MARTRRASCGVRLLQPLLLLGAASAARAQDPAAARAGEGWVVLPVNEYRALRTKAFPPDRPPDPPPVDAAISGVDYELTVNGDSASGQARITIDVLKEGWVRIPMPQGLLIREARLDARPVALVDAAGAGAATPRAPRMRPQRRAGAAASVADRSMTPGTPSLLLSRPGRALLTLDIVVPITTRAGRRISDAAGLRRRARARRTRRAARRCGDFGGRRIHR